EAGEISVCIGMDPFAGEEAQLDALADTLDCLDRLASSQPKCRPVGLIIDEFSALAARGGVMVEAKIRSVAQCHQHLGYVFTGSQTRLMTDMIGKHDRAFYRGGSICNIGPIPTAEFVTWLHDKFRGDGFEVVGDDPSKAFCPRPTKFRITSRCSLTTAGKS